MERVFGFDIGTTSIGSAVIDNDHVCGTGHVLQMGVRIFPEARDPDGKPLNQARRQKRMARRQLRRRRERRKALNEALAEVGLLPPFHAAEWASAMSVEPVGLRARGLAEPLAPFEFGRAIYHLSKRRHFKPRTLEDQQAGEMPEEAKPATDEAADEKKAAADRQAMLEELKATGQTLGQRLHARPPGARRRGVHVDREAVHREFELLWNAQAPHHAVLRDRAFRERIEDAVFAQRPVFWRVATLGRCRLMPEEPLCPKGSWRSQQRRMLEKLNNLAVGTNLRPLDEAERAAILDVLQGQFSMSWGGVRKALGPLYKRRGEAGLEKRLRFNLEDGGEKGLSGNVVEAKLAAVFGTGWAGQPHRDAIRRAVHERLWSADYDRVGQRVVIRSEAERREKRAEAARSLAADFALGEDHAKKLEGLSLPTGWEPYSARALEAFMPHLEAGVRFGALVNGPDWAQWRAETFPDRDQPTGEVHDRLPSPAVRAEQQRLATLRNPTVVRVQNELRKVVNNLISVYGKPDRIRVELAREVGKSKRERDEMTDAIRKQEKRRKDAMADLIGNGIVSPSRDDVEKWLLWTDSAKQCPYTGDHISFDALFRTNQYQVEHIWPRGRSNDDSYGNKVLCRRDVNLAKGDRIPFEYLGHDPQAWSALLLRLEKLAARGRAAGLSRGKIKRFLAKSIPDDFASRQLNDTGYAARQAIASLRRLWPDVGIEGAPVRVHAVTGRVTARLRKEWGLNNILSDDGEKTRADHRHHAVDALVVACAHPGLTQVLSRFWEQKDAPNAPKPHLPPPWPAIRVDAARHIESLVVSHRVCKKISGPLHKATAFGDTGVTRVNNGVDYRELVRRKPLEEMSGEDVKAIRDGGVRGTVAAWVAAHGGDAKKAFATFPQLGEGGPHIYKARLIERKRLEVMADTAHGYFELGLNHHIAIYQKAEGRIESEIVSLFCAARRLSMHEPVVRRDRKDGSRFVMSLSSGDSIQFTSGDYLGVWIVISIWADGRVEIKAANDAGTSGKKRTTLSPSKLLTHGRKISVDPIGRIRPAND